MQASPVEMCQNWARIGLRYPFNEFRTCWTMAGQPLGQRLADKPPMWGLLGLGSLIPEMLAQSMMGYAIVCPDMIGVGSSMRWKTSRALTRSSLSATPSWLLCHR